MDVLYLDEHLLAVNKPAGVASSPGGGEPRGASLYEQLQVTYGRLWIVHRLDKGTSGVMVFARHVAAHRSLSLLFETRAVSKRYHVFLHGLPSWEEMTANFPLRANVGHKRRTVVDERRGQPAVTHFRLLQRFAEYILAEAIPETGRTHQIRAHAAALGFPVLGDVRYGAPPFPAFLTRPALHAYSLAFDLEGKAYALVAPYPEDLLRLIQNT